MTFDNTPLGVVPVVKHTRLFDGDMLLDERVRSIVFDSSQRNLPHVVTLVL